MLLVRIVGAWPLLSMMLSTCRAYTTLWMGETHTTLSSLGNLTVMNGAGGHVLENGINLTVIQMTLMVGGRTRHLANIQLQSGALCMKVHYGTSAIEAREYVLELAREKAVEQAWAREQSRLLSGGGQKLRSSRYFLLAKCLAMMAILYCQ